MRKQLTDRTIKAMKPAKPGQRYDIADSLMPGLRVRCTEKGRRTFILLARYPGSANPTRRSLGDVAAISLADARSKAGQWLKLIAAGIDPAAEVEREKRAEARARSNTFRAMAEDYIRIAAVGPNPDRPRQRKSAEVARDIRREFVAVFGDRPVTEITAHDIVAVLDEAVARGATYQAHNLLGHVRRLFNWGIARGAYGLETSPCDRMKPRDVIGPKLSRVRILSDIELSALWRATGRTGYPFGPLVRLLAVTGQRRDEVGQARWGEFHPELVQIFRTRKEGESINWKSVPSDWKVWTIGAERMKSNSKHAVPLSNEALDILAGLPHFKRGDYLFSTKLGTKPFAGFGKAKLRLDRRMLRTLKANARKRGESPTPITLEPFVLHDIRRTMRTALSAFPITDMVRELVIAHTKPGLHKVYDQHSYLEEKRSALDLWGSHLRDIVTSRSENVVSMDSRRRSETEAAA